MDGGGRKDGFYATMVSSRNVPHCSGGRGDGWMVWGYVLGMSHSRCGETGRVADVVG